MPFMTKEELHKTLDAAFAERLEGNELMKKGDNQGALRVFHSVLFKLKGLDGIIAQLYPTQAARPYLPPSTTPAPKIQEIPNEIPNEQANTASTSAAPPAAEKKEQTIAEKRLEAMKLLYINSAAIHIKEERYKRALECSQSALKIEETNPKAKFRQAQAYIGLGQINKGKTLLEELHKETNDVAVANALKQLKIDEQARTAKSQGSMRGMFNKPAKAATASATASSSSSVGKGGSSTEPAVPAAKTAAVEAEATTTQQGQP